MNSKEDNPAFTQILHLLNQSGADYRLHTHEPVCTMDEAHAKVPHLTRNLVKTIVFKIKQGDWILAAVHKDDRIDYKKLADALGVKRTALRSISPDQVAEELGFQVGGVGPFSIRDDIQVIVDTRLEGVGHIFCGSGLNTRTVEMDMDALVRLARANSAPIAKQTSR